MKTEQFDYPLPDERIAQTPALPRESCKLLVLHRTTGKIEHRVFTDIIDYLHEDDLLVVNDTKVMPARLIGHKMPSESPVEVLLLHRRPDYDTADDTYEQHWQALVKPGRRLKPGTQVSFGALQAEIRDWVEADGKGQRIIRLFTEKPLRVHEAIEEKGRLPLPPYIKNYTDDPSLYQTVYAQEQNSAAAPTAGLHFSEALLKEVEEKGCTLARVCLEIGLDTFRKVEEDNIEDHRIHSEVYTVESSTVAKIKATKERGGRVIAVGTTAVRALESAATSDESLIRPVQREHTQLYITPGYEFKVVDTLITNFHTPRSTLLMLVSAFANYDDIMNAYNQALSERYRFLSFGDAMLIV